MNDAETKPGVSGPEVRGVIQRVGEGLSRGVGSLDVHSGVGLFIVLVVLAIVLGVLGGKAVPYSFKSNAGEVALWILGSLFIVAVFVERAQEVYIKVWRQMGRVELDEMVSQMQSALEDARRVVPQDPTLVAEARRGLEQAEMAVARYRAVTRRIAFIGGMTLGVVIALVGPRLLGGILSAPSVPAPDDFQKGAFAAVDILITGGLIGGGSEGIHKLVKVITDFLDETRNRMKKPPASKA